MPKAKYRVVLMVETEESVHPSDLVEHCAIAAAQWGGQYEPTDPLFSAKVKVKATHQGFVFDTKEQDQ